MQLTQALYVISVAARLVHLHPATLRKYERVGLVGPARSNGNVRLYSGRDIARLVQIRYLVGERGMNLAGVELALELTECLGRLAEALERAGGPRNGQGRLRRLVQQGLGILGAKQASYEPTFAQWREFGDGQGSGY